MTNIRFFYTFLILFFIENVFSLPKINNVNLNNQSNIELLIGIRVQFPENDSDFSTSGNENFILDSTLNQVKSRCSGFIVDQPPHDKAYFYSQMIAVKNYFYSVSNEIIDFEVEMTESVITANNNMSYYAGEDSRLGDLFIESINNFENEIIDILENYFDNIELGLEKSIIVLFHAGIGQDFSVPFLDPTPNDLSSAYIEESMLNSFPQIAGIEVTRGILLPETQNHIYYDVVEDIFPEESEYCNYQVGMTGIFSFLLGYAIGLPPLFNNETGESGVGVFGLMDHGSNNGRGIIPAPPTAWSRIYSGWTEPIILEENDRYEILDREIDDQIFKIPISNDEYFLIEYRVNSVDGNKDIEDIRYSAEDNSFLNWFDVITDSVPNVISLNENNIINSVNNYDIGLPETGLLIWHIKEPYDLNNINTDRENRFIHLEEADGAVDIGFETYNPFFVDHLTGWGADMWFPYNSQWILANSHIEKIEFSNSSVPNTKTSDGISTYIRISEFEKTDSSMIFDFFRNTELEWKIIAEPGSVPVGGDFESVYLKVDDNIISIDGNYDISYDWTNNDCFPDYSELLIMDNELNFECISKPDTIFGYIENHDEINYIEHAMALGDVDSDGLDEFFYYENDYIHCKNINEIECNGFPIFVQNLNSILISNLLFDSDPEIILKDGNILKIYSKDGELLKEEIMDNNYSPIIIPHWSNDLAGLIDGNKVYEFRYDDEHTYWTNKYGNYNGLYSSSGSHVYLNFQKDGIDKNKIYNYPNPVITGITKFRFFNYNASSVEIKIISSNGLFVDRLHLNSLTHNEYNEISWTSENLKSGIYLAEIKPNIGGSHIVHVMVLEN
ncbi:MAG: hypothetical protein VX770_02325 [Candidatus Neomarinimicrobiota bacterium]|nr:hypothetical protein [Candidatus Neomarinimicrobiota bacterium]